MTLQSPTGIVQPFEWLEPFARYGLYYQELTQHTTVYGNVEIHPDHTDPGHCFCQQLLNLILLL